LCLPPGAMISSDEWVSYRGLAKHGYDHDTVNHNKDEWIRGDVHTNGIENLWAMLKRSIKGTHIHVSKKHLPKYLAEFEYRFNLCHSPQEMFDRLLMAF
jgi:transposase